MENRLAKVVNSAIDLIYPPTCPACSCLLPRTSERPVEHVLCSPCREECQRVLPPFCDICGEPYSGSMRERFVCSNCRGHSFAFDFAIAPFLNEGPVRELVHGLKYQRRQALRRPLAQLLSYALDDPRLHDWTPSLVPVPLFPRRQRERGFNQAQEIASGLAKSHGYPIENCLRRRLHTDHQALLGRSERQKNLKEAFILHHAPSSKDILLVDDVLTTGSTADACAKILRAAGCQRIAVLTVARG